MSVSELYHIIGQQPQQYTLALHADHAVYQAHFPGNPITPGACLLEITRQLLCRSLGYPVHISQVHNLKFIAPLTPDKQPVIRFSETGNLRYNITIQDNETTYAKMSATYMRTDTNV